MVASTNKMHRVVTLLASAARTVGSGSGSEIRLPQTLPEAVVFVCDLTAVSTDAADTLDVKVQTKLDGVNWTDVCHFTQMLGNGGVKRFAMKITADAAEGIFVPSAAVAEDAVRDVAGDSYRAVWTIVDADLDASFTFSVTAMGMG